jgi:uncharacterized membrane protein (DUF485 family)
MEQRDDGDDAVHGEKDSLASLIAGAAARRRQFVGTLTILSLGLYFGLLASVLYLPGLMAAQAIGSISYGILVAAAQLIVAASTFWVYCWWADRYDHVARHLAEAAEGALMHGHV